VGGNIGEARRPGGRIHFTPLRVEVSSFQLEGIRTFRPDVAVFLNLSEDHLDRHPSVEAYAAAKARIFENQGAQDWAVVNADDPQVLALCRRARSRPLLFHPSGPPGPRGDAAFFASGEARLRRRARPKCSSLSAPRRGTSPRPVGRPPPRGRWVRRREPSRGRWPRSGARSTCSAVATVDGVRYFNDSKATNILSARKSLSPEARSS
jgi:UDP-N-acetylmuramoylalanine--D-glutamate ligase